MNGTLARWMKGLAVVAGAFLVSSAQAGFSDIGKHPTFEVGQEQIFEHQYGGDWHKVGDDFYNGGISAKRMDDFLTVPSVLNVAHGDVGFSTDQTWSGNKFTVNAVAKWSGNSQELGVTNLNGDLHVLFPSVNGYGYDIAPASKTINMDGQQFKWTRMGDSGLQSSLDSENEDARDHLVTYLVSGLPGQSSPVWMLFFEDMMKTARTPKNR